MLYIVIVPAMLIPFLFGLWLGHRTGEQEGWERGYRDAKRWSE